MGNTPVTIGVSTDKDCYSAGSTVTGRVFLSIKKKQRSASTIKLRIIGKENAVIHHTTSSSEGGETHHYENSNSNFYEINYPLATIGVEKIGQFEYPFSITLPPNLPSNMLCRKGQSYCEIKYEIIVKLEGVSGVFSSGPEAMKPFQVLSIAQSNAPSNLECPQEQYPVDSCCCLKRGHIVLEANVDRAILKPNETFQVSFICRNQSTKKVHTVQVELTEVVEWRANGRTQQERQQLVMQNLDATNFPELRKIRRRIIKTQNTRREAHESLATEDLDASPQRLTELQVPSHSRDSHTGNLIDIRHNIIVTCKTTGLLTSNPEACMRCNVVSSGEMTAAAEATAEVCSEDTIHPMPSAPPKIYDDNNEYNQFAASIPQAEAVLPDDWKAQTAVMIEIPVAQATLLEPSHTPGVLT